MRTARRLALAPALSVLDAFLPAHAAWWALFGVPLLTVVHWATGFLAAFPVTLAIGPFGLAVVLTTVLVRLVANLAVLPLLAGVATYLLTRFTNAAQPPAPEDDGQAAATRRTFALLSPLGLLVAAHFAPAALALYWLTGSLVGAAQQWAVNRFVLARVTAGA